MHHGNFNEVSEARGRATRKVFVKKMLFSREKTKVCCLARLKSAVSLGVKALS